MRKPFDDPFCRAPKCRRMIAQDMRDAIDIENLSFGDRGWTGSDFTFELKTRGTEGIVFEYEDQFLGFLIYSIVSPPDRRRNDTEVIIRRICVHPAHRRLGVGKTMCKLITSRLRQERRQVALIYAPDSNLQLQVFLRACGFRATAILREYDDGHGRRPIEAYRFEYRVPAAAEASNAKQEA